MRRLDPSATLDDVELAPVATDHGSGSQPLRLSTEELEGLRSSERERVRSNESHTPPPRSATAEGPIDVLGVSRDGSPLDDWIEMPNLGGSGSSSDLSLSGEAPVHPDNGQPQEHSKRRLVAAGDDDEEPVSPAVRKPPRCTTTACVVRLAVLFLLGTGLVLAAALLATHRSAAAPPHVNTTTLAPPSTEAQTPTPSPSPTRAPTLAPAPTAGLPRACPRTSVPANLSDALDRERRDAASVKAFLRTYVDLMLSYGPRVAGSGSAGWTSAHEMLVEMSGCPGYWNVSTDDFTDRVVSHGVDLGPRNFSSIIATFLPGRADPNGHIVLAAHFDSKRETAFEFLGASDSAVPCVMILELMRRLSTVAALNPTAALPKVTVMFFDGEEAQYDWEGKDNTYGSRHLARLWQQADLAASVTLFVLLDLIGPSSAWVPQFHNYYHGRTGDQYEEVRTWYNVFRQLDGLTPNFKTFPYEPRGFWDTTVEDDQVPWVALSVPVLHLIPTPFPTTWHTAKDDGASVDYTLVYYLVEALWALIT